MIRNSIEVCGLTAVLFLSISASHLNRPLIRQENSTGIGWRDSSATSSCIRFLAVGDVNLGREVGQRILGGDTLFPFVAVRDSFVGYDVVFANLECTLSDQNGETENPRNNLIFTGPPQGAICLKKAGVTVVSTANNHALDYGVGAKSETIRYLNAAGIQYTGTALKSDTLFTPAIVERRNISIAVFACTDVMNILDPVWKQHVAAADTGLLLPRIRAIRKSVDFVIVSYHGGEEYADRATEKTREFAHSVIDGGADLFLGHHPHVPYGVEEWKGKHIVHSLGNFVFRQPARFWTQRSVAFSAEIVKSQSGTYIRAYTCLPVVCGFQPYFTSDAMEVSLIFERVRTLSSPLIASKSPR